MQITNIEISKLKDYENNPRHNEGAVAAVAESIKQFGFKIPIIVDKDNVIVAGHTRKKAAVKLGLKEVPCIVADDLTPEQIKAFRVADNKTAELAEWDIEKLEEELAELTAFDFDMSKFGFEDIDDIPDVLELPREDIGTSSKIDSLKFGNLSINMTEEECDRFKKFYDNYISANGNVFGLVSELLENGDKNYAN